MGNNDMALAVIEEQADRTIRRIFHEGRWWFSVIDVVGVLTDAPKPRQYWHDMKRRITDEGFTQMSANCRHLKLQASDGKFYTTDAADLETMLRIVQSVPSPKAEPVKQWLAKIGAGELTRLESVTTPRATQPQTQLSDDALLQLAQYHDHLSMLYRQQATLGSRLESIEAVTRSYEQQLLDLLIRVETLESDQKTLPDLLAMLHPEQLSRPHQSLIRRWTNDLCRLTGWHQNMIWQDLVADFAYDSFGDATEADWLRISDWFQGRLAEARMRR